MLSSQQTLAKDYQDLVYALNPNLNPYAQGGDFWVRSLVLGGILSGAYADTYLKFLNVFVQNSFGFYCDKWLASLTLPQRRSAFPASGEVTITGGPASTVTIPQGTQLAYGSTSYKFATTQEVTVAMGNTTTKIPVESQQLGPGTSVGAGAVLTPVNPIAGVTSFTVFTMVDGDSQETDAGCITRCLNKYQFPPAAGAVGDYEAWAEEVPLVTQAFVLNNINNQNIVGVYVLSGGSNVDSILSNPSIPYSRTASTATVTATYNYLQTQRTATTSVAVNSVYTYMIPATVIQVGVELVPNLTLSTMLPTFNMTVAQLISREVRRAIIQMPVGGNRVNNLPYLFASDIADTLGLGLSAKSNLSGLYATILLDWNVTLTGGDPNYPLPQTQDSNGNYPYVYDVTYANITINLLTD